MDPDILFRHIADLSGEAVFVVGPALDDPLVHRIAWSNPALADMTGWSASELGSRDPEQLLGVKLPWATGAELRLDALCCTRADGSLFWVNLRARPYPDTPGHWIVFLQEVTGFVATRSALERAGQDAERAQQRLSDAIEALPEAFVMFDEADRLVVFNSKFREFYPETAPVITEGASYESIMRFGLSRGQYPEAEGREEAWLQDRLNRSSRQQGPVQRELPGGRYLLIHDVETRNGDMVGLRTDVTEFCQQQQRLQEQAVALRAALDEADVARQAAEVAREEAVDAARARERFLANMSHEIRTPMNGILGMAELLADTDLTEDQALCTRTIQSSATALLDAINDILDFSKISAHRMTLREESFSLRALVQDVATLLRSQAAEAGIDLWIDYPDEGRDHFVGDESRLRQVLLNLLGNALKFTFAGHVGIRVRLADRPGPLPLCLSVMDTGIGVPKDLQEAIFRPFEQVDDAQTREVEGTGLGLAISRGLVDQMGGRLGLVSAPDEGSCFSIRLDLPPAPDVLEPGFEVPRLRGASVALAGGSQIVRDILARRLTGWGVRVVQSATLEEPVSDGCDAVILCACPVGIGDLPLSDSPTLVCTPIPLPEPMSRRFAEVLLCPVDRAQLAAALQRALGGGTQSAVRLTSSPTGPVEALRDLRILVADDNRTNQLVATRMLAPLGVRITCAANGQDAVNLCRDECFDLVFMDLSMPIMSGIDAARAIRAAERNLARTPVPIVALTANTQSSVVADCLAVGMDDVLSKPFRKSELLDKVRRWAAPDPVAVPVFARRDHSGGQPA